MGFAHYLRGNSVTQVFQPPNNDHPAEGESSAALEPHLFVNGRFLTQKPTGVQRYAREVLRAMDNLLEEDEFRDFVGQTVIISPKGTDLPAYRNIRHLTAGPLGRGYAWEQVTLPLRSAGGVLLNLCNLAPVSKLQQVVVVHDALTRAKPEAYSRLFRGAYNCMLPRITHRAAKVVTVSQFSRSEIKRFFGVPSERISIHSPGTDHIVAQPAQIDVLDRHQLKPRGYFLAVGMGAVNKNLPYLLDGFAIAGLEGVQLVLTGRRSARVHGDSVNQFPDYAVHVGHVSDGELRALYENAIALVFPSSYEGFGLPPLEAMRCGCPVIVSDHPAMLEVANHNAAHVVRLDRTADLAHALKTLADPTSRNSEMLERGRKWAATFSWEATGRGLLRLCRAAACQ